MYEWFDDIDIIITDEDYSLESEYGDLALAYALANSVKYYIINWK